MQGLAPNSSIIVRRSSILQRYPLDAKNEAMVKSKPCVEHSSFSRILVDRTCGDEIAERLDQAVSTLTV